MAPTRRTRAASPVEEKKEMVLGFYGHAVATEETITALLNDLTKGYNVTGVYLPVSDADVTESIDHVEQWAENNSVVISTVSVEEIEDPEIAAMLMDTRADYDGGENIALAVLDLLKESSSADKRFLILYDPENDVDMDAAVAALEADGVVAMDLANGLELMVEEDDEVIEKAAEVAEEAVAEPAPTAKRRGRSADPVGTPERTAASRDAHDPDQVTEAEAAKYQMVELKKMAQRKNPEWDAAYLRGKDKAFVLDLIYHVALDHEESEEAPDDVVADDSPDEAQATPAPRASKAAAPAAVEHVAPAVVAAKATESVAAAAAKLSETVAQVLEEHSDEVDTVMNRFTVALGVFADSIIAEIRKPKPRGRPPFKK